jgi:hypothetical protein
VNAILAQGWLTRCLLSVIRRHAVMAASRPLCPRKQTLFGGPCTSAKGHYAT